MFGQLLGYFCVIFRMNTVRLPYSKQPIKNNSHIAPEETEEETRNH